MIFLIMEAISLIDESEILTILTIYNSLLENMKKRCWQVPTTNLNAPNIHKCTYQVKRHNIKST